MGEPLRLLLVEDSEDDVALMLRELRRGGYDPAHERVDTPEAMGAALDREVWDLVISDYYMPSFTGLAALALLQERELDVPFIIVTGSVGEDIAVEAMRVGASDYLLKDNLTRLAATVERELREARMRGQRRILEERLVEAEKLESLGRLAGGVAHDLSNILTSILGHADLALSQLPSGHPARSDMRGIRGNVGRATALSRQLLAFARRQVIEPRVLSLNDAVLDSAKTLRHLLGEDVELTTALAPDLWPVEVDPGQIEQVLVSLAMNARDAMPHGGTVTIETGNAGLGEDDSLQQTAGAAGKYVVLAFSDTGVGMTDKVKARLFEPFFTTKPPGEGNGLGLATCYGIVTQNGGHLSVDSEPGLGTTLRIYLPRAEQGVESPSEPEESDLVLTGTETLLLVEDDESARSLIARGLRGVGYTVLEAANGAEALRVASEPTDHNIDLLVTDVVMPQMGGKELADSLTVRHPETKVLFISGYPDDAIARHGVLEAGIALLQKPFSSAELARRIRQLLDR